MPSIGGYNPYGLAGILIGLESNRACGGYAWPTNCSPSTQSHLSTRTSEGIVLEETEELDSKLREFPFNLVEKQSAALRNLSDVLDEVRFKFSHQRKQELAEQTKLLQAQIDAWGLLPKPVDSPFQVSFAKKAGKQLKLRMKEVRKSSALTSPPLKTTSPNYPSKKWISQSKQAPPLKTGLQVQPHPPPRNITFLPSQSIKCPTRPACSNTYRTLLKLEAKLIGTKLRIFPQTAHAYHLIRKYVEENSLESYTYILPEDKKLRLVIRGLPTDMPPIEIIGSLAAKKITVNECHIMTSKKTGKEMPLFLITMDKTEQTKAAYHVTEIGYMNVKVESLRPKYGPPQFFRCQGFFHSSRFCTGTPRCVKCAGNHLAKECSKPINQKPKCCLCEGEHPASFLGCPRNPRDKVEKEETSNKKAAKPEKTMINTPAPPKNVAGNIIRRFCDSTGYSLIAPPEPTRFHRSSRSTTIDIAICKGMTVSDRSSIPELSSIHNPVLFEVCFDNYTSLPSVPTLFLTGLNSKILLLTPYQEIPKSPTLTT
ncbi:nucleic-acid-binding protein from transposon X-element [Trichonephila clavipes]|nr:nucleic-acid-binding protein from transposon X-element [Trichonephila clavipes]